jgi:hypothetical protein
MLKTVLTLYKEYVNISMRVLTDKKFQLKCTAICFINLTKFSTDVIKMCPANKTELHMHHVVAY